MVYVYHWEAHVMYDAVIVYQESCDNLYFFKTNLADFKRMRREQMVIRFSHKTLESIYEHFSIWLILYR